MEKKDNSVFFFVKKTDDSLAQLGLSTETDDYRIACEICKKLNDASVETYIKDVGCYNENDLYTLTHSKILVVVATRESYLRITQNFIKSLERNLNSQKIIYICAESVGEINAQNFPTDIENGKLSVEVYELSFQNSIPVLVEKIYTLLNNRKEDRETQSVKKILKKSCSLPMSFDYVIEREWLRTILDTWLKDNENHHICWICGEHGSGKTFFLSNYCANLEGVAAKGIYYCFSSSFETQNIERIIKAIAYELSNNIEGYARAIYKTVSDQHFQNKSAQELLTTLLIEPFDDYPELRPSNEPIVFFIDGIDELKTNKTDALTFLLEILRNYFQSLPSFFRFIITSPAIDAIVSTMKGLSAQIIDFAENRYQSEQREDAKRFLKSELGRRGIEYTDTAIQKVLTKSECNFDYLHYFIAQCDENNDKKMPPLDDLPKGLTAMFELDFNNRFSDDYYNNKVKPILQIIAAAYEPLTAVDLAEILSEDLNELQLIIKGQLRQFLKFANILGQAEKVSLYNMSVESWLIQNNHKFCIDIKKGTKLIVDWFEKKKGHFYENEYLKKYGLLHVLENENYTIVEKLIMESQSDDFERLKEELGILFVNDCTSRVNVMSELLSLYKNNYNKTIRIRDILVYTYRYMLRRKGAKADGLSQIRSLLESNHETIRASLLIGEGIDDYNAAKKHFEETIKDAEKLVNNSVGNTWWNRRMLGVAYNRLANLENKEGKTEEAESQYKNGKKCFDTAIEELERDSKQLNDFRDDYNILQRDEAIINERLGDLAFKEKNYDKAKNFYAEYHNACKHAFKNQQTLNTKWDLSISLLRLGDAERCLGKLSEAQSKYKRALDLRRDILLHMRNDCMSIISNGNRSYYKEFDCPESVENVNFLSDEVQKESRDIDPIRDIAMCYIRLGDLAYDLNLIDAAEFYYEILVKLCEKNDSEVRTKATEKDLIISRERMDRIKKIKNS